MGKVVETTMNTFGCSVAILAAALLCEGPQTCQETPAVLLWAHRWRLLRQWSCVRASFTIRSVPAHQGKQGYQGNQGILRFCQGNQGEFPARSGNFQKLVNFQLNLGKFWKFLYFLEKVATLWQNFSQNIITLTQKYQGNHGKLGRFYQGNQGKRSAKIRGNPDGAL